MTQYTDTNLGTVNIELNGAFVVVRWNGTQSIRALNPRFIVAGVDGSTLWMLSAIARDTPTEGPFTTEIQVTFANNGAAVQAGSDFMAFCAQALLAGGGP